ncbi:MAG: BTAD domain-containing putative transcriptional regulator, partial [Trueperaceae bacterium]
IRREALRAESQRLAAHGALAEAIGLAATLLHLDPLDETAHQAVIGLHLQRGDLRAARFQFEACRALLDREFGLAPLPETTELGDAVAAAERAIREHTTFQTVASTPPALLRPPVLVGRTAELAAMERVWSEGRTVVLVDRAGAGTSRLVLDAADRRGRYLVLQGRRGDARIPYSGLVRSIETLLEAVDAERLPAWTRRELMRITFDAVRDSGVGDAGPSGAALLAPALAATLRALDPTVATVVIDDLHAFDEDSRRVMLAAIEESGGAHPALAVTAREGALDATDVRSLDALCDQGVAVLSTLPPLDVGAVHALLASIGIDDGEALAADLVRFTGGTPLFVLEVLKDLHAAGRLQAAAGLPADVEVPDRVARTLERRLDDLDREALRAVRVLALAPAAAGDLVAAVL